MDLSVHVHIRLNTFLTSHNIQQQYNSKLFHFLSLKRHSGVYAPRLRRCHKSDSGTKKHFLRLLSHERLDHVRLSIFQADLIGPSIFLYGAADVNGLVSVFTCLPPIRSGKKQRVTILLGLGRETGGQLDVNRQPVHLHLTAHRVERVVPVTALHKRSKHGPVICLLHSAQQGINGQIPC